MDTLDNDYSLQEETKQMKTLQMYQKLVLYTAYKYKISIILIFLSIIILGCVGRYFQFKRSSNKFEGHVTLFYTPRASEEVKPLSLNHVINVFNRQQLFSQLIKELHLTEKQKSVLKQNITVKVLRDHNDMFVISGIGESDQYVKLLVNTFVTLGIRNYEEYRTRDLRNFLENRERRMTELQAYQKTLIEQLHALHRKYDIIHPLEEMETVKKIQGEQAATLAELNVKLADAKHRFAVAQKNYKAIPQNVIENRVALKELVLELRKALREYDKAKLMFAEKNPRFVEAQSSYEAINKEFTNFKKENKITNFSPTMLANIEDRVSRYNEAEIILNQLNLSLKSLKAEMQLVKEKEKKLQQMIPEHERVEELLKTVNKNISLVLTELSRVRSNISHVTNDLNINERLVSTKAYGPFPVKILAIIFIAAIFVSSLYAVIVITIDILTGKFSGIEEAKFHKDFFKTVGIIPHENADVSLEQRKVINNEMFYRFILNLKNTRTLFSCSLNGSFLSSVMFDEQFTKAKRNTILVRLILASEIEETCKGMQKIGNFYYSDNGNIGVNYSNKDVKHNLEYLQGFSSGDGHGYGYGYGFAFFPVRSLSVLEPDEISALYEIVNELKQHYQLIRISREKPFNASCILVRQLHDMCDATLLYIGKKRTPRSVLRRVLKLHDDEHKIYAVLTDVTDVEKIISGDYI